MKFDQFFVYQIQITENEAKPSPNFIPEVRVVRVPLGLLGPGLDGDLVGALHAQALLHQLLRLGVGHHGGLVDAHPLLALLLEPVGAAELGLVPAEFALAAVLLPLAAVAVPAEVVVPQPRRARHRQVGLGLLLLGGQGLLVLAPRLVLVVLLLLLFLLIFAYLGAVQYQIFWFA